MEHPIYPSLLAVKYLVFILMYRKSFHSLKIIIGKVRARLL